MYRSLSTILGYRIVATDGEVGRVHDFFFDDRRWAIRYLVVETGPWLTHRRVLIAATALGQPEWAEENFPVALSMEQVRLSPDVDTQKPVSRQEEIAMSTHYGWPAYWSLEPIPIGMPIVETRPEEAEGDPHLRSLREISTYRMVSGEHDAGAVEDFIANERDWNIRWILISRGAWWLKKRTLVETALVSRISWPEQKVFLRPDRAVIESGPQFDAAGAVSEEYQQRLKEHYGQEGARERGK